MSKFAALISYRGTKYCGFQRQGGKANGSLASIQETIENALRAMTQEAVLITSSGRTDAGVHAVGHVIHFELKLKPWRPEILEKGMNAHLPKSIRFISVKQVDDSFHAQRSAKRKQYSYYYQEGPVPLIQLEPFSTWTHRRLDVGQMQLAIDHLVGEHDFKPFQATGKQLLRSTVRTIYEASISREKVMFPGPAVLDSFDLIRIRVVGSGFLKQMVRSIAGTLLCVGEGTESNDIFKRILDKQDRSLMRKTAPGRGLWLEKVWYEPDPFR